MRAHGVIAKASPLAALITAALAISVYRGFMSPLRIENDLRQLYGVQPDVHGITASLWRAGAALLVHGAMPYIVPAAAFTLCAVAAGVVVGRLAPKYAITTGLMAVLVWALSPFAALMFASPVGAETAIGVLLIICMLADILGAVKMSDPARCILIAVTAVQQPQFWPGILVYAAYGLQNSNTRALFLPASIGAMIVAGWHAFPYLEWRPGEDMKDTAAITLAYVLFVMLPLAVYALPRIADRVASKETIFATAMVLAFFGTAPFFAGATQAACWLIATCGTFMVFVFLAEKAIDGRRSIATAGAMAIFVAAVVLNSLVGIASPDAKVHSYDTLLAALKSPDKRSIGLCDDPRPTSHYEILGDGASTFSDLYSTKSALVADDNAIAYCIDGEYARPTTTILDGGRFPGISPADIAMALAVRADELSHGVSVKNGSLEPRLSVRVRGHGAFADSVSTPLGTARSLTVIAGFTYTVSCPTRLLKTITFAAANPLASDPHADPVAFSVAVWSRAGRRVVARDVLRPLPGAPGIAWRLYTVSLPDSTPCRSLSFAATAPSGHAIATWVSFVAPSVR